MSRILSSLFIATINLLRNALRILFRYKHVKHVLLIGI